MATVIPFEGLAQELLSVEQRTAVIQNAIDLYDDQIYKRVEINQPGKYEINGLVMRSNVELFLGKGVILIGSGNISAYHHRPGPFELLKNKTPLCALIYGDNCDHCRILGSGVIDGNYGQFILPDQEYNPHIDCFEYPRPMTLYFEHCKNLSIAEINIVGAPFWSIHLVGCVNTEIRNIQIMNEVRMPNTDGIDIDRCQNIIISGCEINTGDDGICLKCTEETARYGDCVDVQIIDCNIRSQSSAFKIGSSSFGIFENVTCKHIVINNSNRGIAFQLRDSGSARNFYFKDIKISTQQFSKQWWGSSEPIYITFLARNKKTKIDSFDCIENIVFENIRCSGPNGIFIKADEKQQIRQVTFRHMIVNIKNKKGKPIYYDLRPSQGVKAIVLPLKVFATTGYSVLFDDVISDFKY